MGGGRTTALPTVTPDYSFTKIARLKENDDKKIHTSQADVKRATLQMPRVEAENRIQAQIDKGKQLLQLQIRNESELDEAQAEWKKWSDYNAELLKRVVDTDELVNAYYPGGGFISFGPKSLGELVRGFYSDVQDRITRLESILGRLELIPESPDLLQPTIPRQIQKPETSNRVFVVHGHDEEAKQSVARCIEKLGLTVLILHEQPNQGCTVIEKFENYADRRLCGCITDTR